MCTAHGSKTMSSYNHIENLKPHYNIFSEND